MDRVPAAETLCVTLRCMSPRAVCVLSMSTSCLARTSSKLAQEPYFCISKARRRRFVGFIDVKTSREVLYSLGTLGARVPSPRQGEEFKMLCTHSRIAGQYFRLSMNSCLTALAARRTSLQTPSMLPFSQGQYAVVSWCRAFNSFVSQFIRLFTKWVPWSVTIHWNAPNVETHVTKASVASSAVGVFVGHNHQYDDRSSLISRTYLSPALLEHMNRNSQWSTSLGQLPCRREPNGRGKILLAHVTRQWRQFSTNSLTSFASPCQQKFLFYDAAIGIGSSVSHAPTMGGGKYFELQLSCPWGIQISPFCRRIFRTPLSTSWGTSDKYSCYLWIPLSIGHTITSSSGKSWTSSATRLKIRCVASLLVRYPRIHLVKLSAKTLSTPPTCSTTYSNIEINISQRLTFDTMCLPNVGSRALGMKTYKRLRWSVYTCTGWPLSQI